MKRIVLVSLLAIICISLTVWGTLSLITSESETVNVIEMGDLSIATVQSQIPEGEQDPVPYSGEALHIIPSKEQSLIFAVKNTGTQDAYVRVSLDKEITLASGVIGVPDKNIMEFKINTTDWQFKDGYYYYKHPLLAGQTSNPLYTAVSFSKDAGNMYQESTAKASNFVSATQIKNNGTDVFTATGWVTEN